jgi:hypothetical protein
MLALLLICMQDWTLFGDSPTASWTLTDREEVIQSDDSGHDGRREAPVFHVTQAPFHCPPCDRLQADIDSGVFGDAEFTAAPSWSGMKGYPAVRWQDDSGKWKAVHGYSTEIRDLLLSVSGEPVVKQSSAVQRPRQMPHSEMKALHDRLHGGGSWTWPGDLATHLRQAHGVDVSRTTIQRTGSVQSCPTCPQPQRAGMFGRRKR